jgi:hypothetical protein
MMKFSHRGPRGRHLLWLIPLILALGPRAEEQAQLPQTGRRMERRCSSIAPSRGPVDGRLYLQLFVMNADGTGVTQLTVPPGHNAFPNRGVLRIKSK